MTCKLGTLYMQVSKIIAASVLHHQTMYISNWTSSHQSCEDKNLARSQGLSLQVVFVGSDGKDYPFLLKPDDDLRKDTRMMETAGLLNRLFARDPLSRRRNLYIRRWVDVFLQMSWMLLLNCHKVHSWIITTCGLCKQTRIPLESLLNFMWRHGTRLGQCLLH